jgi:hypothetical protein
MRRRRRRGEAAGNGGEVKLAIEYAAIEVGIVGRMNEVSMRGRRERGGDGGSWSR